MKRQKKIRNITLSANADLIDRARLRAKELDQSLNDAFRAWLEQFSKPITSSTEYRELMDSFKGKLSGVKFDRDLANER